MRGMPWMLKLHLNGAVNGTLPVILDGQGGGLNRRTERVRWSKGVQLSYIQTNTALIYNANNYACQYLAERSGTLRYM
jgi:hypothetical protein